MATLYIMALIAILVGVVRKYIRTYPKSTTQTCKLLDRRLVQVRTTHARRKHDVSAYYALHGRDAWAGHPETDKAWSQSAL